MDIFGVGINLVLIMYVFSLIPWKYDSIGVVLPIFFEILWLVNAYGGGHYQTKGAKARQNLSVP